MLPAVLVRCGGALTVCLLLSVWVVTTLHAAESRTWALPYTQQGFYPGRWTGYNFFFLFFLFVNLNDTTGIPRMWVSAVWPKTWLIAVIKCCENTYNYAYKTAYAKGGNSGSFEKLSSDGSPVRQCLPTWYSLQVQITCALLLLD